MTSDTSLPGVSGSGRRIRGCFLARPFQMPLSLRRTGFSSPIYADKADYCVIENGKVIGRIYEDWYTPPDLRWFWSITAFHIDPRHPPTRYGTRLCSCSMSWLFS